MAGTTPSEQRPGDPESSRLDRAQSAISWFFDRFLVALLQGAFYLLLMLPGLAALLMVLTKLQPLPSSGMLWFLFSRLDSGMQLGLGSFFVRDWLLLVVMLALVVGAEVPARGRLLWRAAWVYHGVALLSGLHCSHPFEGMLTAFDVALLNAVALLACLLTPAVYVPRLICLSALIVGYVSFSDFLTALGQDTSTFARLNGTFYQPNMTATYLACALPWLLNQELAGQQRPGTKLLWFAGAALVVLSLALTQTRAAWLFALIGLTFRWFLGARLRHEPLRWLHLLQVALSCLVPPLLAFAAVRYSLWMLLPMALWLLLGARLSGHSRLNMAWLAGVVLVSALSYGPIRQMATPPPSQLSRFQELAEARDGSLLARVAFYRAALLMGWEHPALGVGPRGFHRYYPSYQMDERWFSKFAHSAPLSVWAEVGAVGFGLFLVVVVLLVREFVRGLRHPDAATRLRILDGISSVMIFGLCAQVDVQWQFPMLPITFAALVGYTLGECWSGTESAPPAPASSEPIHAWTLRPRIVFTYFQVSCLAVLFFLNQLWTAAHYHSELAEMILERNHPDESITFARRAITLNPYQGSYYHQLGLALVAARNKSSDVKAEDLLHAAQGAIRFDSHRAVHWDLLAKAYVARGDSQQAQKAIRRALECDPVNYPSFYTALAEQYPLPQGREERFLILEACLRRFPPEVLGDMPAFRSGDIQRQLSNVYLSLADLSNASENPKQALSYYDRLLQIQPKEPNARLGRIVCLINLNDLKQAHKESLEFYQTDPRPEVLDIIKHLYYWEKIPLDPKIFGKSTSSARP